MTDRRERAALRAASRPLTGGRASPAATLEAAAAWCREHEVGWDQYGRGTALQAFEAKVADLLGYPAARFFPSGTQAQLVAMRVWCDRAGVATFGLHPTSHLELHEERGYAHAMGLRATLVGPRDRPMRAPDLTATVGRLGAVLTELPAREIGGQLPTWDELEALKAAAAERGVPLHLDGARLWCCGAAYGRPLHEVTAGFASCYVSFYKSVGALPGAMLLGPADVIAEAAVWQRRLGGNLYSLMPSLVTAAMRLDATLASMPARLERARAIASAVAGLPGIRICPDPPHSPLFHVHLDLDPEAAAAARDRAAREHGIWLFGGARDGVVPGTSVFEVMVGEATMAVDLGAIRGAFAALSG